MHRGCDSAGGQIAAQLACLVTSAEDVRERRSAASALDRACRRAPQPWRSRRDALRRSRSRAAVAHEYQFELATDDAQATLAAIAEFLHVRLSPP
jgi:hypothetical protein